ncbi:Alpha/Beta hydrolase protein [Fomitopsis serialis]|uniref:Alpha/Beta hydrolase protein n=1 Tax=Fomitopsis serialis TaxID=139415 RepID=UPI002008C467|nr:Alpha/Beta hydrolase protein [Neoantrodia serialis]KAH9915106.1 Alpha/Beta hydrolase protein [Neoantrodia serialis]
MSSDQATATLQNIPSGHQLVKLPSGTIIECDMAPPPIRAYTTDERESKAKLALCLHPWSWLGGCMDDPVLRLLVGPLNSLGYHRWKSSGWPSLTGSREAQDLRELVQWAIDRLHSVESVVLVGYSYGSLIASLHPPLPHPKVSHIMISYPLTLTALVRDDRARVLIVHGDHDDFTDAEIYEAWTRSLAEAAAESVLEVVKVEGATHFWREGEARVKLVETIETWLT